MKKSIENIWPKGFLDSNHLKAVKINNLYNKKSALVINKLKKTNTLTIVLGNIASTLLLIGLAFLGYYITAISLGTVFTLMDLYYRSILKPLKYINTTTTSYDYLITYKNKFRQVNRKRSFFMGAVFPLIFIFLMYIYYNEMGIYQKVIRVLFGTLNNVSILLSSYIVISITMFLIAYLSKKAMYSTSIKKINEIIADMEELRT